MSKTKILIYGANGYAGGLISREYVRRQANSGWPALVLAGRSDKGVGEVARDLKCESRVFPVQDAAKNLDGVSVVVHCAGPFSETAKPMMEAALQTGTHYVDISGEIEVFQFAKSQSKTAADRNVILCPGAGFDIVPTDCLAAKLKSKLPSAQAINLAFTFGTLPSVGTMNTVIEGLALGGLVRRNGLLTPVANGYRIRKIRFQDKARWCVSIPWADVYTSGLSTGVPNGMVLTAMPWLACHLLRATTPFRGVFATKTSEAFFKFMVKTFLSGGPDRRQRMQDRCQVWGEAVGDNGERVVATLSAPNVYALTVEAAIEIALHCSRSGSHTASLASPQGGFYTASQLMGADFGLSLLNSQLKFDPNSN